MNYEVKLAPATVQQIKKLDAQVQKQVIINLEKLAQNPFLVETHPLKNQENLYLFRLNHQYRIVYQLNQKSSELIVLKVAHQSDY
ncbi:MAG TPA: type II toxin-antitoxin system RelE/ParE family toxin [Nostocaceae cyanobacterium]|nr:type II toxin-antitoxin system RelE/ParE family toxin [Nostocaceae cyanobacterium]